MRRVPTAVATAILLVAAFVGGVTARSTSTPAFQVVNVGAYGGEPSIVSDTRGNLYDTTPSGGTITYRSTDAGRDWQQVTTADPNSGDDCLATDQSNAVYLCNLAGSEGVAPLQADVWKSINGGATWSHGAGDLPQCGTSCSPFGVDRDWVAASILSGKSTSKAEVVLMYHDFYGPSQIWVNISHDGGATFGLPIEVLAHPAVTPGAVAGTLVAQGYTFCNTVPAGVQIVRPGIPHAGRIFVAWIAADLAQNATGCNVSMLQSFHTLWISYSDDNGLTWTAQQAFAAGDPGQVDVAYLRTSEILPTDPFGKANPGGCAGPGPANGNPANYPPPCPWNLYGAQSTNLTLTPGSATWTTTQITTTPMHIGDICNLGIFCLAPSSNRNLLDFIMETLDPSGCAHIAYADDNTVNKLRAANQTSGPCIIGHHHA